MIVYQILPIKQSYKYIIKLKIFEEQKSLDIPVNVYVSGLSDPVAPVLCLGVHGRVPVGIVKYHSVGARQIHPHPSGTCRQNKRKNAGVPVETFHQNLPDKNVTD